MTTTTAAADVNLVGDFKTIMWKESLWYNLLRASCAGIPLGLFMLLMYPPSLGSLGLALAAPITTPLAYLMFAPFWFVAKGTARLTSTFGGVGELVGGAFLIIASLFLYVCVIPGDPIVALLSRHAPHLVPIQNPPFFNRHAIALISKPQYVE
jgi:hypothetical protein